MHAVLPFMNGAMTTPVFKLSPTYLLLRVVGEDARE